MICLHFSLANQIGDLGDPWKTLIAPLRFMWAFFDLSPKLHPTARWLKQDLMKCNSIPNLYLPFWTRLRHEPCHPSEFPHDVGSLRTCSTVLRGLRRHGIPADAQPTRAERGHRCKVPWRMEAVEAQPSASWSPLLCAGDIHQHHIHHIHQHDHIHQHQHWRLPLCFWGSCPDWIFRSHWRHTFKLRDSEDLHLQYQYLLSNRARSPLPECCCGKAGLNFDLRFEDFTNTTPPSDPTLEFISPNGAIVEFEGFVTVTDRQDLLRFQYRRSQVPFEQSFGIWIVKFFYGPSLQGLDFSITSFNLEVFLDELQTCEWSGRPQKRQTMRMLRHIDGSDLFQGMDWDLKFQRTNIV